MTSSQGYRPITKTKAHAGERHSDVESGQYLIQAKPQARQSRKGNQSDQQGQSPKGHTNWIALVIRRFAPIYGLLQASDVKKSSRGGVHFSCSNFLCP